MSKAFCCWDKHHTTPAHAPLSSTAGPHASFASRLALHTRARRHPHGLAPLEHLAPAGAALAARPVLCAFAPPPWLCVGTCTRHPCAAALVAAKTAGVMAVREAGTRSQTQLHTHSPGQHAAPIPARVARVLPVPAAAAPPPLSSRPAAGREPCAHAPGGCGPAAAVAAAPLCLQLHLLQAVPSRRSPVATPSTFSVAQPPFGDAAPPGGLCFAAIVPPCPCFAAAGACVRSRASDSRIEYGRWGDVAWRLCADGEGDGERASYRVTSSHTIDSHSMLRDCCTAVDGRSFFFERCIVLSRTRVTHTYANTYIIVRGSTHSLGRCQIKRRPARTGGTETVRVLARGFVCVQAEPHHDR